MLSYVQTCTEINFAHDTIWLFAYDALTMIDSIRWCEEFHEIGLCYNSVMHSCCNHVVESRNACL